MYDKYPYEIVPLPYDYNALEPHISAQTLSFHHDKHLQTYVDNLNKALADAPQLQALPLTYLLTHLEEVPVSIRTAVQNNGGGVYNHNFYFAGLTPAPTQPSGELKAMLARDFGSVENFLEQIKPAANTVFGSGWAWLVMAPDKRLKIVQTPNQITPLKDQNHPLLNVDVWEHAYYLDYQNRRPDYVTEWEKIINWDMVSQRMELLKMA